MLPNKLKDLMYFRNGLTYRGQAETVTPPKLSRKIEEWRGAGMDAPVPIDMGQDGLMEMEVQFGGPIREILTQFGDTTNANFDRYVGAYQADDTGAVVAIEITTRGMYEEMDMGESKVGDAAPFKVKQKLTYYKLDWNGSTLIEIDALAGTFVVDGVDRRAAITAALGG